MVVLPGEQRLLRSRGIRRASIQIEERTLGAVDQLSAVRRPFRSEVASRVRGETRATRSPDVVHPDIALRFGGADINGHARPVGRQPRIRVAILSRERGYLFA